MMSFSGLEEPDYEKKAMRVRDVSAPLPDNPWKALAVDGFSECGVEFQGHSLLKQRWGMLERYLYTFNRERPEDLAQVRWGPPGFVAVLCWLPSVPASLTGCGPWLAVAHVPRAPLYPPPRCAAAGGQ